MKVLGFRFRSGEDVIAEVLNEDNFTITVRRPIVPVQVPDQPGKPGGMQFLKWAPFAKGEEFTFSSVDYVGAPYEVWDQLEKSYIESVSGIAIASAVPPKSPGGPKLVKV
jgi:hypothetical protein